MRKTHITTALYIILIMSVLSGTANRTYSIDLEEENKVICTILTVVSLENSIINDLENMFNVDVYSDEFIDQYRYQVSVINIDNNDYFYLSHGLAFPINESYILTAAHIIDYLYYISSQPQMLSNDEELKPLLAEGLGSFVNQGNSNSYERDSVIHEILNNCLEKSVDDNRLDFALKLLIVKNILETSSDSILSHLIITPNNSIEWIESSEAVKSYEEDIAVIPYEISNSEFIYTLGKYETVNEETDIRVHIRDYISGNFNTLINPFPVERIKCQYLGEWQNKNKVGMIEFRNEGVFNGGWSGSPLIKDDETVVGIVFGNVYDPLLHRRINLITPIDAIVSFLEEENISYYSESSICSLQLIYSINFNLDDTYNNLFQPGYSNFQLDFAYNIFEYISVLFSFSYDYFITKDIYEHTTSLSAITLNAGAEYKYRINHFLIIEPGLFCGWKYKLLNTPDFNSKSSLNKFVVTPFLDFCFIVHDHLGFVIGVHYSIEFKSELDSYQSVISPVVGLRYVF